MLVFSGEYAGGLSKSLASLSGQGEIEFKVFPNNEQRVVIKSDVRGKDCVVVQSGTGEPDKALVQTLLMIDGLKENGARSVKLVMPFMAYSLQSRNFGSEPVSSRVVARAISASGVDGVLVCDVHERSILNHFSVPVTEVSTRPIFIDWLERNMNGKWAVVSPDVGSFLRANGLIQAMDVALVRMEKKRDFATGRIKSLEIVEGEVTEEVVITDDILNTGGTIERVSKVLRENGARRVVLLVTHFLGVEGSMERVGKHVDVLVTTNSIDHGLKESEKVKILDVAGLIKEGL